MTISATVRKAFTPSVILILGILAAGLIGLRLTTSAWEWAFSKKELPLRYSLDTMPQEIGPYRVVESETIDEGMLKKLSSENYVSWIFRDTRKAGRVPGSAMHLHVVYYTGNQEPVSAAHVPEICYVGSGFERVNINKISLPIPFRRKFASGDHVTVATSRNEQVSLPGGEIPMREFVFLPPGSSDTGSVIYFFIYNGQYIDSRSNITLQFLDRRSGYTYYAKVEVLPGTFGKLEHRGSASFKAGVSDVELSRDLTAEFLSYVLPEIVACLPDWQEVESGKYPSPQNQENTQTDNG